MSMFKDIEDFHVKFGLGYEGKPRLLNQELQEFRTKFLQEELDEYRGSIATSHSVLVNKHLEGQEKSRAEFTMAMEDSLDALVDLVYVALGTAYLHGFDFEEAWKRVHAANMAKVRAERTEDSKRGTTFDVVKPAGWQPPRHTDLVINNEHVEEFS